MLLHFWYMKLSCSVMRPFVAQHKIRYCKHTANSLVKADVAICGHHRLLHFSSARVLTSSHIAFSREDEAVLVCHACLYGVTQHETLQTHCQQPWECRCTDLWTLRGFSSSSERAFTLVRSCSSSRPRQCTSCFRMSMLATLFFRICSSLLDSPSFSFSSLSSFSLHTIKSNLMYMKMLEVPACRCWSDPCLISFPWP